MKQLGLSMTGLSDVRCSTRHIAFDGMIFLQLKTALYHNAYNTVPN